ncbi:MULTISPECIES: DUF2798 domain-containing protein [Acinetobacter]|uniref:DUF2798 domain-containing protein n=1 Tax=Acinetobacter thutiue TaxID=2998078 RepID=A0ABT7WS76_9GAMM|nr:MULTISPECIES: DUF2798 domain-containing protein [Acinetobacter]MCY6413426.1 DUF2798 domain-containing protein [Acinetobacter thutiue]MDH0031873.1 DUF2798 domain-containing protein [Acinetobacter sp. GD04021]MDH0887614.1 DUF2798 domain-containing protein [Acinetobacter sp. GD03873]MDH1083878.1 DUF2798 domain-containing protein [Acinetobacter sp. GD03983]MDH2190932.1 DUF2798 domain-containing protein [Acinetobacter sp. GD03645]
MGRSKLTTKKRFMAKLPAKYAGWIIPLLLSCLMSGTISFINLLMNMGFNTGFINQWLATWMFSWAIAYPVVLVFLPLVRRLTGLIVEMPPH